MSINNSVPAFPSHGSMGEVAQEGMTLRDYFAAKALQGLVSNNSIIAPNHMRGFDYVNCDYKYMAAHSYELADAMLTAREVQS